MKPRHLHLVKPMWMGPVFVVTGVLLLVSQVYAYFYLGVLHTWLLGGGFALLLVGAIAWYYYMDDQRAGPSPSDEELPTADEYDCLLKDDLQADR